MIYRQRNKSKWKGYRLVLAIFIVLVIFRFFNFGFWVQLFNSPINYVLESHTAVLSPLKNTLVYFKSKKELEEKNNTLQSENTNLKLEVLFNQTLSDEFESFKNQFGTTTIGAQYKVILRPPFIPFDNIRITGDLSSKQVGDFVFYKSILIGKIIEKDNRYATVELFSTPNKITPVVIKDQQFEAAGLGGGRFVLESSKEFTAEEGDAIIYPESQMLVLGVVEFVESKEEDLFKKIYFNTPVSLSNISYVTVGI